MIDRPVFDARLPMFVGFVALILLVFGIGIWSVRTQIAGAVIATGMIVVENNRQVIQHPEGGVVGMVEARDGDVVAAGDLLIRLDDTLLRSELAVAELQLVELGARRARLTAERDGAEAPSFPPQLLAKPAYAEQVNGQLNLFKARLDSLEREDSQIAEQIAQTGTQIVGTEAQLDALKIQESLILDELTDVEALLEKGLVQSQRASTLRREAARLAGEIGRLTSDAAQFRGQIAELEIGRLQLVTQRRESAINELRDTQFRELELIETAASLRERLSRLEIRAPVSGIIHGSTVFAQKAVIQPADPLMYVIPQDQQLIVSARVDANHVDQVHVGQRATLRFSAFNQRLTPEVYGQLKSVSADVLQDEVTGLNYYNVEVVPLTDELPKLQDQELVPGMPVEVYLRTDDRTPLSYLTKPLTDYFSRAFRES